ncbi:hypothetical protein [Paenimyroides baculatum]|uniref:Uncharacterized protein n=1 Tax=Paenimyroides baculatum TaxID=2608000 RepID=A0A5M6CR98_9FLAO|nr:hypothetical protein [Paenimyroides baculatum]KAA5537838.1 hypothetical protein F0460_04030 [Paenimyroides baculatum]
MKSDDKNIPGSEKNKKTSPTDIKGKDVHEANQTNSGAGASQIKEGSNLLPEDADKVPDENTEEARNKKSGKNFKDE